MEEKRLKSKDAQFYSILSDGSTDSSIIEEEIVYARYVIQGEIFVRFLGLQSVPKADASTIAEAISTVVDNVLQLPDWKDRVVAYGTDGAAVMTGSKNGVVTRLRGERDHILGIHCMAHRLELAFKDAAKSIPLYHMLDTFLLNLYYFYHKSPLNRSNLKNSFQALDRKPLMPTRVGGTRWLPHILKALDHFLKGYLPITQHLQAMKSADSKDANPTQRAKGIGFLKLAISKDVVFFACFMHDVLTRLAKLSETLQRDNIAVSEVFVSLESTRQLLSTYHNRSGPMLRKAEEDENQFDGQELSGSLVQYTPARPKILDAIDCSLENRFQNVTSGVLKATHIANISLWPSAYEIEFGNEEVEILVSQFTPALERASVDIGAIPDEWIILKSLFFQSTTPLPKTWPEINRKYRLSCPGILSLIDLVLTLPAATAVCERGFNHMKMIKSDWRSSLSNTALNDLMTIMMLTPDVGDFNPIPAVELWSTSSIRSRRPDYCEDDDSD